MDAIDPEVEAERLRQVRALIEQLLREADICGQVVLAGREGRFEAFSHLGASWSNARIEQHDGVEGVRVRSLAADYRGQAELREQHLAWSVGVVSGFAQIGAEMAIKWLEAAKAFDEATDAEHTPLRRIDPRDDA